MKINDKHLAHYASCTEATDKEGWLWKKGELNTSYQKRWCALRGNLLFYFEKRYDRDPIGVIVLENCSVQLAEGGDSPYTFSIHFLGEGTRVYKLTADDDDTCTSWIKALSISSYRYLEILVDGLEREVETLKSSKKSKPHKTALTSSASCSNSIPLNVKSDLSIHENHFGIMSAKSSSMNNILEATQVYNEDDLLTFNVFPSKTEKKSSKIPRSKSFNELAQSNGLLDGTTSLKVPGYKPKSSVMKKLSPRLGKKKMNAHSKTVKSDVAVLYHNPGGSPVRSTPPSLKFLEMHERFRQDIEIFVLAQ